MIAPLSLLAALLAGQTPGPVDPNAPLPPNHPPMDAPRAPAGPSPDEMVRELDAKPELRTSDNPFEIALSIGKVYYSAARYRDAAEFFGKAWAKAAPFRALAKGTRATGGECAELSLPLDQLLPKLQAQPQLAGACVPRVLPLVAEAAELRATALFLSGDSGGALAQLDELLALTPDRVSSLYARAGVRLDAQGDDVAALRKVKADLARVQELERTGPRAEVAARLARRVDALIAAGGARRYGEKIAAELRANPPALAAAPAQPQAPQQVDPLGPISKEAMEAVENTEKTPELMAGLAKLVDEGEVLLAQQRYDEALGNYVRVMPFDPQNARAQAGMAWAMVGLKRPAADRIWNVAVQRDPAAVEKLGEVLQAKGDRAGAVALWKKLAASAPDYAARSGLARRLE